MCFVLVRAQRRRARPSKFYQYSVVECASIGNFRQVLLTRQTGSISATQLVKADVKDCARVHDRGKS